jgi:uncharacterized protein (TIGR02996 family)
VTEADLLREILACPDDDAPRLALADWLEENSGSVECARCGGRGRERWECKVCGATPDEAGEVEHGRGCYVIDSDGGGTESVDVPPCPDCAGTGRVSDGKAERASFIRCQIELAAMHCTRHLHSSPCRPLGPGGAGGPFELCESLRRRANSLWGVGAANGSHWSNTAFAMPPGVQIVPDGVRRGFVHAITCTAADFLAHAAGIFAAQPVQSVEITDMPIFKSGGNDTYYVGGLGRFPQEYWSRLEWLPSPEAARAALSAACVAYGRERAGVAVT